MKTDRLRQRRYRRPSAFIGGFLLCFALTGAPPSLASGSIPTAPVEKGSGSERYIADGYVEALRQSAVGSQVPGRVTVLTVKAGDTVRRGQVLARIDQRAATQQVAASQAQVAAAEAQMEAARRDYERSRRLFKQSYISQAAMDQAEAQYKALHAQARALIAQAAVASTQTTFHVLTAPYTGVVSDVTVEVGDMVMPGKSLIAVYDPAALRVVAMLPERYIGSLQRGAVRLEFPSEPEASRWYTAKSVTVLPTRDSSSHTVEVRLDLPAAAKLAPGAFARAYFPIEDAGAEGTLTIPLRSVVKRAELDAVYVLDASGHFQLRQVRLGKTVGKRVVVLAGLEAGERVALDPYAAAKQ